MRIGKKKRPRDVNQRAHSILQDVIRLSERIPQSPRPKLKRKK